MIQCAVAHIIDISKKVRGKIRENPRGYFVASWVDEDLGLRTRVIEAPSEAFARESLEETYGPVCARIVEFNRS
jgi:hypothetical protein